MSLERIGSPDALRSEFNAKARDVASNLYRNDGETPGKDSGDWVKAAEAKLMGTSIAVRDSGPWFHCNCEGQGIEHAFVRFAIDQTQVLVHLSGEDDSTAFPQDGSVPVFYWAKWPQEVDPTTAAAYVKAGKLTIEVKKMDSTAAEPAIEAPTSPKA